MRVCDFLIGQLKQLAQLAPDQLNGGQLDVDTDQTYQSHRNKNVVVRHHHSVVDTEQLYRPHKERISSYDTGRISSAIKIEHLY